MKLAACHGQNVDVWFREPLKKGHTRRNLDAPAKEICGPCPVRYECLDYAMRQHIDHGVWGGFNTQERKVLRRLKSQRGRPLLSEQYDSSRNTSTEGSS